MLSFKPSSAFASIILQTIENVLNTCNIRYRFQCSAVFPLTSSQQYDCNITSHIIAFGLVRTIVVRPLLLIDARGRIEPRECEFFVRFTRFFYRSFGGEDELSICTALSEF